MKSCRVVVFFARTFHQFRRFDILFLNAGVLESKKDTQVVFLLREKLSHTMLYRIIPTFSSKSMDKSVGKMHG